MSLCKCGCGKETINTFVLGHNRRRIKICEHCGNRIWKYCSKNQRFCSEHCQYSYLRTIGYLPKGELHSRWKGGKKATYSRQWLKIKSNPTKMLKIHNRLHRWYETNATERKAKAWLWYHMDVPIKEIKGDILKLVIKRQETIEKARG